jgi:hypothetical protein
MDSHPRFLLTSRAVAHITLRPTLTARRLHKCAITPPLRLKGLARPLLTPFSLAISRPLTKLGIAPWSALFVDPHLLARPARRAFLA